MSSRLEREILSVSALNQAVKQILEQNFGLVWIEGEISNLARPASGHIYFSLKDAKAQVRCAMFRAKNALVGFAIQNGTQVLARARVGMYEARGEFQLIVEHLEPAGEGLLRLKLDQLKRQLAAEGLFDEAHKRELPQYPETIGVITSASGAALRDILTVLRRRNPAIEVIIYPTSVQGENAKSEICHALKLANARQECDVLILARGGGSLEDLWSFNEESVVRAVFESELPIVVGVGHEIDFSLADFAADLRAATPSAAAEICAVSTQELLSELRTYQNQLMTLLQAEVRERHHQLGNLRSRFQHPGKRIEQYFQRSDELSERLPNALKMLITLKQSQLDGANSQIMIYSPASKIKQFQTQIEQASVRLGNAVGARLEYHRVNLREADRTLHAVSPNATLERGYAILSDDKNVIARNASDFAVGDSLNARLSRGQLTVKVAKVIGDD